MLLNRLIKIGPLALDPRRCQMDNRHKLYLILVNTILNIINVKINP
jgi:hypothetical protein